MKLTENEQIRTITIRIKDKKDRNKLFKKMLEYKHFENMLLILIQQNYDLFKDEKETNDFGYFCDYRVMRALVSGTEGGKAKEKVEYIRKKYQDNKLFEQLLEQGKKLKTHNLAMVIKRVKANYKSFFTKIKNGDSQARPPKPKKLCKITHYCVPLDINGWTIKKNNYIGINLDKTMMYFYVRHTVLVDLIKTLERLQAISIALSNGDMYLKIHYVHNPVEPNKKKNKHAGLDVGVNNLAGIYIHDQISKSLIICGKKFKHYNSCFNRLIAKLSHTIDELKQQFKKKNEEIVEQRLRKLILFRRFLFEKRKRFFQDQFHKMSTRILEYLQRSQVTVLYLSYNLAELKNNGQCKMRKASKQNFIQIPFIKFLDYLQYKAFEYGISTVEVDEAYTSKTSCLTADVVNVQKKAQTNFPLLTNDFAGTRVKRGLFKDRILNLVINADLNAAANIVKIGLQKNFSSSSKFLFKLCNPIKIKSDWDLVRLALANTVSDNTSFRV